jgi:hypothetical protein
VSVPPPTVVPPPPADPDAVTPLEYVWPAAYPIHRSYDVNWGARQYFGGSAARPGRFHPIDPGTGDVLPVLYGADEELGALSETVFHDVPVRGTKVVPYSKLLPYALIPLQPTRDLRLVDLTSDGLSRLGVSRVELIESDPRSYTDTAAWSQMLHAHQASGTFDGLMWVSRQRDTSRAVMLFGDRVKMDDLVVRPGEHVLPLATGRGLDLVAELADRADITISGLP